MNRSTFLTTLAGGTLALPRLALADAEAETALYDLLDAVIGVQYTRDFEKLATMLHPGSTEFFRNELSASFDVLLRAYSLDQIVAVSGLRNHPKDLNLSDAAIFVAACNSAGIRHPEFVGDPKHLPLKIHGTVFDTPTYAHVLYSYAGAIRTERTDYAFVSPRVMTFRHERDGWLVYSTLLARAVTSDWWSDLAESEEPRK